MLPRALLLASLTFVATISPSRAVCGSVLVKPDGTGDYTTIQTAVDAVAADDTIFLGNGLFRGAGNRDISVTGKHLTFIGESGQPENVVIDCEGSAENPHRAFLFQAGGNSPSRIVGLTIVNGYSTTDGGGIFSSSSSLEIDGVTIRRCVAARGGGLFVINPLDTIRVTHSTFVSNEATSLGGGTYQQLGFGIYERVRVDSNKGTSSSSLGGGMALSCDFAIRDSWVRNNTAGYYAGLFLGNDAPSSLDNVQVAENFVQFGGGGVGIDASGPIMFTGCSFQRNEALLGGGAMVLARGSISVDGGDFSENTSPGGGGAGGGFLVPAGGNSLSFANTMFLGNCADSGAVGYMIGSGNSLDIDHCTLVLNDAAEGAVLQNTMPGNETRIENSILAFNLSGCTVSVDTVSDFTFTCNDVYGNADGDYICALTGLAGGDGNFSYDPYFCDTAKRDFSLAAISPCLSAPECGLVGAIGNGCSLPVPVPVSVESISNTQPIGIQVKAFPNPFNPSVAVAFFLREASVGTITILDVQGQAIKTLAVARHFDAGRNQVVWDGTSDNGQSVGSGVYFFRIRSINEIGTGKLHLIR